MKKFLSLLLVAFLAGVTGAAQADDTLLIIEGVEGKPSPQPKQQGKKPVQAESVQRPAKKPDAGRFVGPPVNLLPSAPALRQPTRPAAEPKHETELVRLLRDPNLLGRILSAPADPDLMRGDIVTGWLTAKERNLPCKKRENCIDLKEGYVKAQFLVFKMNTRLGQYMLAEGGRIRLPSEYGGLLMDEIGHGVKRSSCVAYVTLVFSNLGKQVFAGPYPTSDHLGHYRNLPVHMKMIPAEGGLVFPAMAIPFTIVRDESRAVRVHFPEWIFDGANNSIVAIQIWQRAGVGYERMAIRFLPKNISVSDTMFSTPENVGLGRRNDLEGERPAFTLVADPC